MPDKLCIVGHLAAKQKKHKRITDRTFLISESKGQYRVFLLLATGGAVLAYLRTICPTVVPGDSGELITACFTLGIAHWPGYPLYVILGNIALNIFTTAEPAYVMNLMSVAFGVLTVGLLYAIIYHFIRIPFLAASVSLLFGFGQTFWSQTVIAEVYTLHTFMVALVLFLFTRWLERRTPWVLYVIPFFIGLACTNHQLSLLLLPTFIYMLFIFEPKPGYEKFGNLAFLILSLFLLIIAISVPVWGKYAALAIAAGAVIIMVQQKGRGWKYWLTAFGCFIAGLLLYLYLPIRASQNPVQNWGNPDNLVTFIEAVLAPAGSQSPGGNVFIHLNYLFNPFPGLTRGLWEWSKGLWMFEFLSPVFFLFGLWGIYTGLKTKWRMARTFLLFILLNLIVILTVSQPAPKELFKVDVYYLQAFLVFSVFIAVGIKEWLLVFGAAFQLKRHHIFAALLIFIILMAPLILLYVNYPRVNRSDNFRAYDFAMNIVAGVDKPAESILLVNKDDLFILWYLDRTLGYNPMPTYPLVPLPGMPVRDFWLSWYNHEIALEEQPRVIFPLPQAGKAWLTPEDELTAFLSANMGRGRAVYLSSYGLWGDINVDMLGIPFIVLPHKSIYKAYPPNEFIDDRKLILENLDFWHAIFDSQGERLSGFADAPDRRPQEEFIFYRYADSLYRNALWASNIGMHSESVEFCRIALEIDPYRIETHDLISHELLALGDPGKAELYLVELLRMYPDNADFHYTAATFYRRRNNLKKALGECNIALELDPGHPKARVLKKQIEQATN